MKVELNIMPTRSGKSTLATEKFLENSLKTLFIVHSDGFKEYINYLILTKSTGIETIIPNFMTPEEFINEGKDKIESGEFTTIVIDDYLLFKNKIGLYRSLIEEDYDLRLKNAPQRNKILFLPKDIENIIIYTSTNKAYNEKLLNFIKERKETKNCYEVKREFEKLYPIQLDNSFDKEIEEMYYSFLTDSFTSIIDDYKIDFQAVSHLQVTIGTKLFQQLHLNQWKY